MTRVSQVLSEAAANARNFIMSADNSTGYCMCGSPVDSHGMGDGHSPVDEGVYHANRVVEEIDAALAALAKEQQL